MAQVQIAELYQDIQHKLAELPSSGASIEKSDNALIITIDRDTCMSSIGISADGSCDIEHAYGELQKFRYFAFLDTPSAKATLFREIEYAIDQ